MAKYLRNLDLNGNQVKNLVIHKSSVEPNNPVEGQIYYNTSYQKLYLYSDNEWKSISSSSHYIGEIIKMPCATDYIPDGCLPCDGQEYSATQFPDLWENYLNKEIKMEFTTTKYAWIVNETGELYYTSSEIMDLINDVQGEDGKYYEIISKGTNYIRILGKEATVDAYRYNDGDITNTHYRITYRSFLNTCTYDEYDNEFLSYGQCGKFAIDVDNYKFKVPTIKDGSYLTQALSDSELGKAYNESLPNIRGSLFSGGNYGSNIYTSSSGAFNNETTTSSNWRTTTTQIDVDGASDTVSFDASRSSSVYQDGANVQGENIRVRFFIVVSNAQENQSTMDWSTWANTLASKAGLSENNEFTGVNYFNRTSFIVSPDATSNDDSIVNTNWVRNYVTNSTVNENWVRNYIALDYNTVVEISGTGTKTAPYDGVLIITPESTGSTNYSICKISINGIPYLCSQGYYGMDYEHVSQVFFPFRSGDTYTIDTLAGCLLRFVKRGR